MQCYVSLHPVDSTYLLLTVLIISTGSEKVLFVHHSFLHRRYSSQNVNKTVIVRIPQANIYRFGDSNIAAPVFREVDWTINEGESWAVIGSGSNQKTALLRTLLGHLRISPPPAPPEGLFPFLSDPPRDPHTCISLVSFAHRQHTSGGAFYDYTARYGAVRDEDCITLRQSMFGEYDFLNIQPKDSSRIKTAGELAQEKAKKDIFDDLSARLGLSDLLDLPLVALSNGQTRRARIIKAILSQPELLVLDEPLTGLDLNNRPTLLSVLHALHSSQQPRIIMGLRLQDPLPDWISHLALVKDGKVITGAKDEVLAEHVAQTLQDEQKRASNTPRIIPSADGKPVVDMKNVNVVYQQTRKVLKSINWTIREGERWHLQGANGSGKTTLLSLLTGDHPQSYTQIQPASHLHLFSRPRARISTPHLRYLIGVVSPELGNAFPRRAGVSVWEVVGTGFDGTFVPGGPNGVGVGLEGSLSDDVRKWRVDRVREVLSALGPSSWKNGVQGADEISTLTSLDEEFAKRDFADLSAGEQSVVLLMRALVSRPQLVLLDEVWSGMDDAMVRAARRYLREGGVGHDQAVVVISHWEGEVPWGIEDGLRRFKLDEGVGREV
ncbi:P-loop containing nucleoside triphosphate hydrolase protein [Hygrophoropsis aurantiaca]|uniref:P-loop containing nucleoside triphosphate hydrolase protein n=1 Tax=Hygrophoropsis aurantiaca TaxID=72124 RepID=A0ACB8AEQ7_9AGAM|nr:P-loop containing nucleoside triphosphate hydrolase protein [Hygrophoropsis aurantiaca]